MHKFYVLLLTLPVFASFAQMGQIMNGGFENWSNTSIYNYPTQWGNSNSDEWRGIPCVLQSSDASTGTYSVELTVAEVGPTPDTLFGYVYQGSVGQGGPDGGIAYTSAFDEVRFQFKSDLPAGDTVYLIYVRFISSVPVETNILPAVFGTNGTWTQGSVTIPSGTQDELFLGFVVGDPFNQNMATPGSWARIDDVQMFNMNTATTALPDPSFETWAVQTVETPDNWFTLNEMLAGSGFENANKTTDSYAGTYALELSTVQEPNFGDTINGFISMGPFNFNGMNPFLPAPYNASPTNFSGAYKYSPSNGDQATIQVIFTQAGNPVGVLSQPLSAAASYTTFNSPITLSGTPDSIIFVVFAGDNPGSILQLDELSFSGGNVGLEEFASMNVNIYPNPANDVVFIKAEGNYDILITDVMGKTVFQLNDNAGKLSVDLTSFANGSYFITLIGEEKSERYQLIVR